MKKLLSLFILMLMPLLASADAVEIGGLYYNLVKKVKTAEVTHGPNHYSGSVVIPEMVEYEGAEYSVTSIGISAFSYCRDLTSIAISNSVTNIGDQAFWNCNGLTSVYISDLEAWCNIKFGVNCSNPLYYAYHLFLNGEEIKELEIPNSVTSIKDYAFQNCSGLTSLTIPNSVTSIGDYAFQNCSGLTSLTIPNSVTSIGYAAFSGCSGLTSIAIPNSFTSIGNWTFENCSGLTSITIPNSVTSIGEGAFASCSGLTLITIPNSVTSIGMSAFYGCRDLTSIAIPNSVTSIGNYAFASCTGLTSITIPNSVTSIGYYAFQNCSGLTSITIGSGVSSIGTYSFASCPELSDVYCYAEAVPSTYEDAFKDSYTEYATLHVPTASIDNYKSTVPWSAFKTIVSLDGTTPEEPETQKCEKPTISYQNGQLKFNCATEGVSFVTNITDTDIKTHYDATISLTATYNVSVYATKSGYENSDVVTATLCWIDVDPKTEGITNSASNVRARAVLTQSNGNILSVQGTKEGEYINVYDTAGHIVGSARATSDITIINTTLNSGDIGIVKIGEKSVKIIIR